MTDSERETIEAMQKFGGGFVRRLGEAWIHADQENARKLRMAFPQYWDQYAQVAANEKLRARTGGRS